MSTIPIVKTYPAPPFSEREILRYAGSRAPDEETLKLMRACMEEAAGKFTFQVCYRVLDAAMDEEICDFGLFRFPSRNLAKNLAGCKKVLLFAATVGVGIDRLIARYSRISPAKALMFQALGAERIEALCDRFCQEFAEENRIRLKPRFSPGYGDLPLSVQTDIFTVLECPRKIGLTLNSSLLMSPSKSVTAFAGIIPPETGNITIENNRCSQCMQPDCAFRSSP